MLINLLLMACYIFMMFKGHVIEERKWTQALGINEAFTNC